MTKTKSRFFTISFWRNVVLGAGLLSLFGSGIFTFTMAQTNGYYIIDSTDSNYPQGCNTPGLSDPANKCILALPHKSGKLLIAPSTTDRAGTNERGYNYCRGLNIAGFSWRRLGNAWGTTPERQLAIANRSKIMGFNAPGAHSYGGSKHYWVGDYTTTKHNCIVGSTSCGSEGNGSRIQGNRCVSFQEGSNGGERCFDFSEGTITNYKKGAYPECGASVTIPATIGGQAVTAIGDRAFYRKYLTSVTLPNTLVTVGKYAFEVNHLSSIVIPDSVVNIQERAFAFNRLNSIQLSQNVTNIGIHAFTQNNLTSVVLPNSLATISDYAFHNNPGKPALGGKVEGKIKRDPSTVTVAANANIQLIYDDGSTPASCFGFSNGTITSYNPAPADCGKDVVIPKTINGQAVTAIGYKAFYNKSLTSVILPDSVTTIGSLGFAMNGLTSVILPDSVTMIGDQSFGSNRLTSVTLSNSLITISDNSFTNNKLTSVTIPNSVTTIGYGAFFSNRLVSVSLSNSINTIGGYAFSRNLLSSLILPDGIDTLSNEAFSRNQLTSVKIPSSVTRIDQHAFSYNPGKPALGGKVEGKIKKDPSTVTVDTTSNIQLVYDDGSTPASCFGFSNGTIISYNPAPADCGKDVVIPSRINGQAVVSIGGGAFHNKGLTSVTIPSLVTSIGEDAFSYNQLTGVTIPNSVIMVGREAFAQNQLILVTIGDSLQEIEPGVFAQNQLTGVMIPNSVISIMWSAFANNPGKPELGNKVEGIIKKDPSTVTVATNANIELIYNNDTPEHCFQFSNGKILKYKKDSAPECGADVVIPRQIGAVNVTSIEQKAFENMGITSVKIPSTVQFIGAQSFIGNDLTTLEVPDSVREIGLQAFAYNKISSISGNVTNHATHVKIGPAAFNDNRLPDDQAFFYSRYVPLVNLTRYTHYWGLVSYGGLKKDNVKVPTKTSQVIAMYAFFKTNVNSVLLPEGVKILGRKAFASNNLTKVVLPESLTHIYPEAFVNNPGKVEYVGKVEGLVSVDPDTIMNMTGSNIELIGLHTPAACFDFTNGTITNYKKGFLPVCGDEVKIPKQISGSNVTRIGAQAFLSKRITSVVFPDTLVEIGNEAFKANRLTGVVLPNTLIKISDFAFVQNFGKPELGNKVEGRIKKDPDTVAVADNANIELVREYTPTISSCFEVQSGVILDYKKGSSPECGADVVIPSQISGVVITQIGVNAFSSKGLHSVIFPSTLVRIQASAFSGNQLSSVELPNSVVQIDAQAFSANMKNPVWAFRNAGLTGLSLAPNANLLINPLFLDVAYENLDGETLLATGTFVGSGKSDFTGWGPATASQWFQPGQTHKVIPPVLTGYLAPAEKEVRFPTRLTRKNNRMSIKLIYQFKPELILHYAFDQASNLGKDSSVRANHGSHTNMTSLTGRVERSVFVKGGTKLTSKRPVYVDGAKAFTVAYRVKPEQLAPNTRSLIDASAGNQGFRFGLQQDGRVHFFIGNGAHTATMACGTESLPMHRWSHVAGVFNMLSGSFDCYLDGKQIGTVSLGAFTGMIAQPLVLGKHSNDYQLQFDELKVWNYALTPQKLKAEYDQGNTPMVTITYLNEWDEAIKGQTQTVIKTTSSGQLFQMDTNYTIKAPNLHDTQAIDPKQQTVRFSINQNNALELTFKYKEHYCRRFEGQYKVSKAECKALSDFYTATQGHAWTNNQGWNQMGQKDYVELCTWKGVNCTATKVTALQLPNNNLNGSLPNTFKQLNHLERLDLSRNASLRNVLIQLHHPHLKELNLNGSQLNEAFPVNFFQRNSKLEKVFLTDAALHGTLPRLALTLKELMLNKNRLTGKIPSSLAQLQHLEKLNLEDNLLVEQLPDALRAARFPHLKAFSLAKNYIAGLSTSHVYRGLQSKNKKLNKPADQDPNLLQQKILFWSDNKGVELKKLDQLSSGQVVTVKIIRQVWKQGKWALGESLAASELVILNQNNITLVEERSPEYRIKLTNPDHDGFFILGVRGADHTGEWTKAQITLSTHDLPDEEINKPGDWSITGGIQSSELDKGGLHFELGGKYLDEFFSAVHFNVAGNDFGGGFFWLPVEKLPEPIVIETKAQGGTTQIRKCHNKVRGFYYNSQRGERLWPLDPQSQQALRKFSPETYGNDLDFKGGWYTSCEGVNENCTSGTCVEDPFGIYGAIIHTYKGEAFHLNAGIAYNTDQNRMKSDGLRCNFQRLNNSYYFGYIYDDRGHIGFVGAKIKTGAMLNSNQVAGFHGGLNQLLDQGLCMSQIFDYDGKKLGYNKDNKIPGFPDGQSIHDFLDLNPGSAKTTLFNLGIKGIIGLTTEINNEEKKFFEGNTQESTLLLRTDATISKVVNTASKHAEALCRGKWQQGTLSLSPQVICINDETSLLRSGISAHDLAGKTVVVKDQNLVFSALMDTDDKPINLFIDRGNLMLPAVLHTGTLSAFDAHGYPDTSADPKVSKAGFLRGNFIINGLLLGGEEGNDVIENKLYIHGKLVSFNTFKQPTEERVRTVKNLLEAAATWNELYKGKIAMDEVFAWRCDLNIGTDGTWCQGLSKQEREQQGKLSSLLVDKAFGLIDMDFASPFFD